MSETQLGLFPGFDRPADGVFAGYLPEGYADETSPPARPTPNDWIATTKDGSPVLSPWELFERVADLMKVDSDVGVVPLKDGDVVPFLRLTEHGTAALTVKESGEWNVSREPPPGARVLLDGDPGDHFGSVEEIVRELVCRGVVGTEEHTLTYYEWSAPIPYRFEGKRFVPCQNEGESDA